MTDLANGVTIGQLARRAKVPRRTMFRWLSAHHAKDQREAERRGRDFVAWMYRVPGGRWKVNVGRLRLAHPEFFEVATVDELDTRVRKCERDIESLKIGHRKVVEAVTGARKK